jgi:hypothetical protein
MFKLFPSTLLHRQNLNKANASNCNGSEGDTGAKGVLGLQNVYHVKLECNRLLDRIGFEPSFRNEPRMLQYFLCAKKNLDARRRIMPKEPYSYNTKPPNKASPP